MVLERLRTGAAGRAEKPIVPAGLRLNDSIWCWRRFVWGPAWRWSGAPWWRGDGHGELVQLTAVTVPTLALLANRLPRAENRPEVARFIARLEEEIALWRQQISAS